MNRSKEASHEKVERELAREMDEDLKPLTPIQRIALNIGIFFTKALVIALVILVLLIIDAVTAHA